LIYFFKKILFSKGILRALNVNKLVDAGVIFIFWVADWFGLMNNKMGGIYFFIRKNSVL
jgi:tyrosyl-tRNA synthetase